MQEVIPLGAGVKPKRRAHASLSVAIGILFSRIAGLIRERVFAYFLGNSDAAGAFRAALRIPNLLQNLFGEGVLSASFIPVYAKLLAEGKEEEAEKVAGIVASLLALTMAVLVLLGVIFSRQLIEILAPGFQGEARELTVRLVAIMFPATGLLVLSAWCLGVLNSHRQFFLSYVAPVLWNIAIITMLLVGGRRFAPLGAAGQGRLVIFVAWAAVIGAALQLGVQLPNALSLNHGLRPSLSLAFEPVHRIILNFFPAVITRGVVQLSAYIDQILASFLGPAAVAAMAYAQTLYTLPVSLFGMSISAAELPEMSRATGSQEEIVRVLTERLTRGLRRMAYYVIPSAIAFVTLGDVVVATLFQTGHFGGSDSRFVWYILAGSAVGLVASTQSRLCVSVFWAVGDTKTPMRFAILRVLLTALLGYVAVFPLRLTYALDVRYCAALLTASAGIAGWFEFLLIRGSLSHRIGRFSLGGHFLAVFWAVSLSSAAVAFGVKIMLPPLYPALRGLVVLAIYGGFYLAGTLAWQAPEAREALRPILRRFTKDTSNDRR